MPPSRLSRSIYAVERRLGNVRRRVDGAVVRVRSLPRFWEEPASVEQPNTLFSRTEARRLRGHAQRIAHNDPTPRARVAKRRIRGIRDWEYGTLLGAIQGMPGRRAWEGLDVGAGNSTFPLYLVESGNAAKMTTLDLPGAYEGQSEENRARDEAAGIARAEGSMLDLPFPPGSFDLVTCISAIEHLDGVPKAYLDAPEENPQMPYEQYVADTATAVASMASVVKPGGLIYLTTDAYIPDLQTKDAWNPPADRIWSAYRFEEIEDLFVQSLLSRDFELVGQPAYDRSLLLDSADRSTYRGRYFTTFALLARKAQH